MGTLGGLNSAGPLIVRVRTEGLGGGRRWSVGLGGEGDIVGFWRVGGGGSVQGDLERFLGCRWGGLLDEDVEGVGYSK